MDEKSKRLSMFSLEHATLNIKGVKSQLTENIFGLTSLNIQWVTFQKYSYLTLLAFLKTTQQLNLKLNSFYKNRHYL